MNAITWFLLFTQVILFLETRLIYASRLCCDPDCKTPISYGKTRTRSLTGEEGRLSYPANAKVTIYSKGQRGADGVELLEAEILGRKGLLPKENVIEISTLCVPTHIVNSEVELDEANHAPSSDVDHTSSDAAPNQATLSVESNEPIFNVMPPDSGNQDNSESEEATSYDPGHGQDASHDLSYSPIIGAPTSSTTGSHDTTAPPVGSHDTTAPTTGSHDTTAPPVGSYGFSILPKDSHGSIPDHVIKWMEEHHTPSEDVSIPAELTDLSLQSHSPELTDPSIQSHSPELTDQSHSLELTDPSTQSHSPELTDPSTHEQRHIEAVHQEGVLLPKDTVPIVVRTSPLIDLGQDIREGYGSQNVVGLSPDPSLQEELDGTPLSLLKLYDTPIKDSPHAVPSIHYSPHAVPSVQYSPHAVPPIQYSPHVEPSVGDLAYLTPTKPGPELIISQDGHTPEGRQDGHTPEGRQDGHTPESRQDGRTPESRQDGRTPEGRQDGHTLESRQDGHTPEGRQDNHTPDGRQDGLRYETNIPVLDSIEHISGEGKVEPAGHLHGVLAEHIHESAEVQSEPPLFSLSEDHHSQASSPDEQEVQSQNKYLTQVQEWFLTLQQVEIGLLSVLGTLVAMVMPLCIFWCQAIKQSTQKSGQLKAHEVSQSKLEEQLEKVKLEKDKVVEELHTAKTMCQLAENKHTKLQEERLHLESELQAMAGSHTTITQQLTLCQAQFENLKTQLAYEHSVLEAMTQEKVSAQQQLEQATTQVQQLVQRVQELEATKDQLEQDIYTSQQNLEQMQDWGSKINVEYEAVQTRCLSLESELDQANTDVAKLQVSVKDKDEEMMTLRQCLQQVVDKEQTDGENAPLARIQAMLDTTKVQVELQKVLQEKELLTKDLQECVTTVAQLKDSCKSLEDQVLSLLRERDEAHKNHQETQMKLKGLTEYFEQKEHALHTKLGAQEVEKMAVQSKRQEAMEKASLAEQERERERVELADLRRQMAEIEKSHAQQVMTNEKRVEEALCQLRKTEEELRQANRKITLLQKQLAESEHQSGRDPLRQRPPSAGPYDPLRQRPPSAGPHVGVNEHGPAAPPTVLPSTSQPRTSSPSSQQDTMEPGHNMSYPGAGGRPPSHSMDRRQPSGDHPPPVQLYRPMPLPHPPPWMRLPMRLPMVPRPYYRDAPPFPPDQLAAGPPVGGFMRPPMERPDRSRPPSSGPEVPRPPSSGPERGGFQPIIPGRPGLAVMGSVPQNTPRPYIGGNSFTQP